MSKMKNPLTQFFPVDFRIDGVYVTVPRDKKGRISCEKVFAALESAQVTNYDRSIIQDVIERARGAPEKIGPLFEYYNKAVEEYIGVTISDTDGSMKIDPAFAAAGISLTPTLIRYCLKKKGIRAGLLEENIQKVVSENLYDSEIVIAEGRDPVDGRDARIHYEVEFGKDLRPRTRQDGSADFRKVHTFTQVTAGQVIARKIPATSGEPGVRVTGEPIPSKPGDDCDLPQGHNTELAEDGLALIASKTGLLKMEGSLLSISEQLIITKDIDYSVGNIKFSGDVVVEGNIKPGFTLETEGDIEIQGVVESATVKSRNGSVAIRKGVLGKGDAFIYAKSKIEILFAQEATLETEGIIQVDRHCLHCESSCDMFEAIQPQSSLVGGMIKAFGHVCAKQIGNSKGADTRIVLYDTKKGEAQGKLKEYLELKKKILVNLEPVKKEVSAKAAIFKKAGDLITDRQKAEMKKWIDSYNVLNMKLKRIQERIDKVTDVIKSPSNYSGYVKVTGSVFPGTILEMYGRRKLVQHRLHEKIFRIDTSGEIAAESDAS